MSKKTDLVESVLRQVTLIAQAMDSLTDSISVFLDREYNAEGSDPLTDDDLVIYGITLSKFVAVKGFIDNLNIFVDNGEPVQGDYDKILNELRTDK